MCYEANPIEILLKEVNVEVGVEADLAEDLPLLITPISIETKHFCLPTSSPNAAFQLEDSVLCFGDKIIVIDSTVNILGSSIWNILETNLSDSTKSPPEYELKDEGEYYLKHVLSFAGCEYVDSLLINIESDLISTILNDTLCDDESKIIDLSEYELQTILWDDGDSSGVKDIVENRTYSFEYTTLRGCSSIEQFSIERAFSPEPMDDQEFVKCEEGQLIITPGGPITPTWNNIIIADTFLVKSGGIYTATFSNYCGEETQVFTIIDEDCDLSLIANIFSPNGDGVNDIFDYSKEGIQILEALIYDRWGNPMHVFHGEPSWDGKTNGSFVSPGVYTYYLKYKIDGISRLYHKAGDITVIR